METFIILGMCFVCYELCELFYQCNSPKGDEKVAAGGFVGAERSSKVIYSISERAEVENQRCSTSS